MFDIFTDPARQAIVEAQAEAVERGDATIGTEHELLGIAQVAQGHGVEVLRRLGVDVDRLVADPRALNRE